MLFAGIVATAQPLVDPPRDQPRPFGTGVQADEVERPLVSPELNERRCAGPEPWIGRVARDGLVAFASGILLQPAVAEDGAQREVGFPTVGAPRREPARNVVAVLETASVGLEDEQIHSGRDMAWISASACRSAASDRRNASLPPAPYWPSS